MGITDLRGLIKELETRKQVVRITDEVFPEPDVTRFVKAALDDPDNGPALIFENIKGYKGQKLVFNTLASWKNWATAFDVDTSTSVYDKYKIMEERWPECAKGEVEFVDAADAPCQECVIEGDDINMYDLPMFRSNTGDGGFS